MAGVDREVVRPLVEHPARAVRAEVGEQRVVAELVDAVAQVEGGAVALVGEEVVGPALPDGVAEPARLCARGLVVAASGSQRSARSSSASSSLVSTMFLARSGKPVASGVQERCRGIRR